MYFNIAIFCLFNELKRFADESEEPKSVNKVHKRNGQWRARRWEKGVGTHFVHL